MRLARCWLIAALALVACDASRGETPSSQTAPSSATSAPSPESPWHEIEGVRCLVLYTGGAEAKQELPMLIAIHGLGDQPERFAALVRELPVAARVVVPQGFFAYHDGYSWFDLAPDQEARARALAAAATRVARLIDAAALRFPTRGHPVVTGFSQGGMLSFALAVAHPRAIAGALPLAGALPRPLWPESMPSDAPPIVALHGDADNLLAIEDTRAAVQHLRALGFRAELHEFPGVGHSLDAAMRRELARRLAELLGGSTARR
jgi:phospholipase/carboxylesterase